MPSHAKRQKKYLTKLKGRIGGDQYKEQGSRRRKLKKQENLDLTQEKDRERQNGTENEKRLVKQLLHHQHTKQPVP